MNIESGLPYECGNGGTVIIITDTDNVHQTGVDSGFAFWGDIYVNSTNDMSLDVASHDTKATLEYNDEEVVMTFNLTSRVPSGRADIEFRNLRPDSWYRLLFDGNVADSRRGKTFNSTDEHGTLTFNRVTVPNE